MSPTEGRSVEYRSEEWLRNSVASTELESPRLTSAISATSLSRSRSNAAEAGALMLEVAVTRRACPS